MPTYEYACPNCGNTFEKFQSMKDEPLKTCPKCGKTGVKRLLGTGAGLIFKGSGFYITDYKKSGGGGSSSGSDAKSSTSESKSTSSNSDHKSSGTSSKTP
jgi:putative FmdB family regulatory protein